MSMNGDMDNMRKYGIKTSQINNLMLKTSQKKKARYFIPVFLSAGIIIYTLFLVIPILDSIKLSFYDSEGLYTTDFVGLGNYIKLFTEFPYKDRFFNALSNTIKFFLMVTLIQNVCGFLVAVLVTRKFKGNTIIRRLSFLPTTLSVLVVGFLFKLILNPTWGVFDRVLEGIGLGFLIKPWLGTTATALPVLAVAISWQWIGEAILFYTAGIDSINEDILEAAKIDGAGILSEIRHIILPSIMPIVGIVTILIYIGDFTQFDIVYAMTTTRGNPLYGTDLLGSLFYRVTFQTGERGGWGMGMGSAVAAVMVVIVFIGVLFYLRIFRMKGAEKE
jgi:raffinose/stachyose/melibiose transport system permease protein